MNRNTIKAIVYLCLTLFSLSANAGKVPFLINCQGRLFDGEKLLEGDVKMVLRVYQNERGGQYLYEDSNVVKVVDGIYSTYLGDNTTHGSLMEALNAGASYLEVIANGINFSPREKLVAVPYALVAERVKDLKVQPDMIPQSTIRKKHIAKDSIASFQILDGEIKTDDLADGAVTPRKMQLISWTTSGNFAERGKSTFLGTLDNRPLELRADNKPVVKIFPHQTSPNLIMGSEANVVGRNVAGTVISGGGNAGQPNQINMNFGTIGGGRNNSVKVDQSITKNEIPVAGAVGGGAFNLVRGSYSVISGGYGNQADGYVSSVGGGWGNKATGVVSSVMGGQENVAGGSGAAVSGGWGNRATGKFSIVPGGRENKAAGDFSLAAGHKAKAEHQGSFVWADAQKEEFVSTGENQFLIRAKGNVGIGTAAPDEKLTVEGTVKAKKFIGDGSLLTGLVSPKSILPNTEFGGMVQGTFNDLQIKKASIQMDHLEDRFVRIEELNQLIQIKENSITAAHLIEEYVTEKQFQELAGKFLKQEQLSKLKPSKQEESYRTQKTRTTSSHIFGSQANAIDKKAEGSVVSGGGNKSKPNRISGEYATIGGGLENLVSKEYGVVGGGIENKSVGASSVVSGGWKNEAAEVCATVGGGQKNQAFGPASTIGGGFKNIVSGRYATVPGGLGNQAGADYTLAAGHQAKAMHQGAFVWADAQKGEFLSTGRNQFLIRAEGNVGIDVNQPDEKLTVSGNVAPSDSGQFTLGTHMKRWRSLHIEDRIDFTSQLLFSEQGKELMMLIRNGTFKAPGVTVTPAKESPNIMLGHPANKIKNDAGGGSIGGGGNTETPNQVLADYGTVSGGFGNIAQGYDATVSGGQDNDAAGLASTISGGFDNKAHGKFSTVSGGVLNRTKGNVGTVSGGYSNKVEGSYAVIPGGYANHASGHYSLAAGTRASARHEGSYVWADASHVPLQSTGRNQYLARASGGFLFYTNPDLSSGVKLNPGSGSFSMLSDRAGKENMKPVDYSVVLQRLKKLPLYAWNYKTQNKDTKHIGPTAQDFRKAFGLGQDNTHISAVDADGVSLAAIRGLQDLLEKKEKRISVLEKENLSLQQRMNDLEEKMLRLIHVGE